MTFGEKYELQESLTTGVLETFIADDKVRGERVLVHVLQCDPQKPNQPTVQWVLEAFRRIAPEPVGLVLETGRYGETLYAYLVTKLPEPAALRGWVQRYEDHGRETQDLPAVLKPTPESEAPTADLPSKEPARIPGPISQLFHEFDQQAKPVMLGGTAKEEPQSAPMQPFAPSKDHSGVRKPLAQDLDLPAIPAPPKAEPTISSPTSSFRSDFKTNDFAPESISPETKIGPRPGEFTSFFQGPFRGDSPSEIPAMSAPPVEPPRKTVGDFTAVFGAVKSQPEEPLSMSGIAGNEPAGSGFTGWFKPDIPLRTSSTTVPPPASTGLPPAAVDSTTAFPPSMEPFVPEPPVSRVEPPILSTPAMSNPVFQSPAGGRSAALPSDGATRSFASPVTEPVPSQPEVPSEPSAYTQIISVKPRSASTNTAGGQKEAASKATTPPPSPALIMPPVPVMAPPPLPPLFSKPAAPAMPQFAVPPPPAPQLAKVEPPPSAVSYWPLILTLTVLFFIAVLLVLYFLLKH